jgi:hypothetical protein
MSQFTLSVEHASVPKIEELLRENGQSVYAEENFIVDLITELRKLSIVRMKLVISHGIWCAVFFPMKGGELRGIGTDLLRAIIDMSDDLKKYRKGLEVSSCA